ncbi:MAG: hypothetical protein JWM37_419 [Candidatus Saccharibacteria bacterium]|nr:hypothetical protein [Candidatus Saccharibacteria bacterium]
MAVGPIINPTNLKIEGFYCQDNRSSHVLILVGQDIRDRIPEGIIIDDYDVLTPPEELIRLEEVIDLHFELINKSVCTVSGDKVGKVSDFATDLDSLFIHKLYVSQSIVKHLTGGSLVVDRNQITEITADKIIIEELLKTASSRATVTL